MSLAPYGRRTHPPPHRTFYYWLREEYLAEGESTPPPPSQASAVAKTSGDKPINVVTWGDPDGDVVDDHSPNLRGEYGHPGDWPVGISVEGIESNH